MISIVIRNKNEAKALENTLPILIKQYSDYFDEIILVDNNSIDNSIEIAKKYNCKVIVINDFTYGKALNLGIEKASNEHILLLSAHVLPIGASFFKSALNELCVNKNLAGIRFINSYENYLRAIENDYEIVDGLKYGLMNACSMIKKSIWENYKFDEQIVASEDKVWSDSVIKDGYEVRDISETYFYFINRDEKASLKRIKIEMIANYQFNNKKYPSLFKMIFSFFYHIFILNSIEYLKKIKYEIKLLKVKIEIKKMR